MKNKGKICWPLVIVFVTLIGLFFGLIAITFLPAEYQCSLLKREVIASRVHPQGMGLVLYPELGCVQFVDGEVSIIFKLSETPQVILDYIRDKKGRKIDVSKITPKCYWLLRGSQEIRIYSDFDIVVFINGDIVIDWWKSEKTPKFIKKIISENVEELKK